MEGYKDHYLELDLSDGLCYALEGIHRGENVYQNFGYFSSKQKALNHLNQIDFRLLLERVRITKVIADFEVCPF